MTFPNEPHIHKVDKNNDGSTAKGELTNPSSRRWDKQATQRAAPPCPSPVTLLAKTLLFFRLSKRLGKSFGPPTSCLPPSHSISYSERWPTTHTHSVPFRLNGVVTSSAPGVHNSDRNVIETSDNGRVDFTFKFVCPARGYFKKMFKRATIVSIE